MVPCVVVYSDVLGRCVDVVMCSVICWHGCGVVWRGLVWCACVNKCPCVVAYVGVLDRCVDVLCGVLACCHVAWCGAVCLCGNYLASASWRRTAPGAC